MSGTMLRRLAASCMPLILALGLSAQKLTVDPSGVLQAGTSVTVDYSNPSLANTDVTIEICGGFPVASIERVTIHLDDQGKGSGSWTVNGTWLSAGFNAPGVNEVSRLIRR